MDALGEEGHNGNSQLARYRQGHWHHEAGKLFKVANTRKQMVLSG